MKVTIIKNGQKGKTVSSLTIEELVESLAEVYPQLQRSNSLNSELGKVMRGKRFEYKHRNTGAVYRVKQKGPTPPSASMNTRW